MLVGVLSHCSVLNPSNFGFQTTVLVTQVGAKVNQNEPKQTKIKRNTNVETSAFKSLVFLCLKFNQVIKFCV